MEPARRCRFGRDRLGTAHRCAARLYGPDVLSRACRCRCSRRRCSHRRWRFSSLALMTRGLHLDGLADTVDGLASQLPAEEALDDHERRPVGALGAAALIGCLVVEVLALTASVLAHHGTQSLVFAVVSGRVAMLWACTPRHSGCARIGAWVRLSPAQSRVGWPTLWTIVVLAGAAVYGRATTARAAQSPARFASRRRCWLRSRSPGWSAATSFAGSAASPAT